MRLQVARINIRLLRVPPETNNGIGMMYASAASYAATLLEVNHENGRTLVSDTPVSGGVAAALPSEKRSLEFVLYPQLVENIDTGQRLDRQVSCGNVPEGRRKKFRAVYEFNGNKCSVLKWDLAWKPDAKEPVELITSYVGSAASAPRAPKIPEPQKAVGTVPE